ncbi:MAG TPA: phage tail protein, partial [Candidatus Kurthia intestinigallinarum]|nr:phage tail protein [Candidatus Kurthia intestinigallinarum]
MLYLYDKNTIDFTNNGGPIRHSYDEHVIREEGFYLTFKLLLDKNSDYKKVKKEMIVSAETPDGRNQFRVYDIVKHQDHVEVLAVQLMYDFDNKMVNPFKVTNVSGTTVINRFVSAFKASLGPFTLSSSVSETHDFATNDVDDDTPSHNALEVLNRITNRWDSELLLNGYDIRMVKRLGAKTNALLYEKKNISEFEDESSVRDMATRIYATSRFTAEGDDEETVISVTVDSPLINEYAQIYEKSFVNNDARTKQELINWVNLKYSTENTDKPTRNIKVSTNIIDGTEINYGDELVLKYLIHDVDEV